MIWCSVSGIRLIDLTGRLPGDYDPNFFGHVFNNATYIVNHPEFGWLPFGGNVKVEGDWVSSRSILFACASMSRRAACG